MAPTCHSLSHTSACAAQCAVMAADASRSSRRCALPSWRAIPFSRPSSVAKSSTTPSRARHLPHSRLRLALLSFSSLGSPWTAFETTRARRPDSRASLHSFQIHRTRSSSTSLASSSTSPLRAPSTRAPGILGFAAAGHQ